MTFQTLALTYVLGGLTFVPLLLAAIIIPAWYLLPQVAKEGHHNEKAKVHGCEADTEPTESFEDEKFGGEGAASGTFAVLRSYNLQAALTALNARTNNGSSTTATEATDGTSETSESVYQSMYRSVFKGSSAPNTLQEQEESTSAPNTLLKRKPVAASVFYIVQRHGHLMLYDSLAQLEVRHVISLAHHTIRLSDGEDPEEIVTDGDLFIKRTAIVLDPLEISNGQTQSQATSKRPFYLFSATCSEKEDFYHALLYTRTYPPVPRPLAAEDLIKLQSTLHSSSLSSETRAVNALVGRVFLALYRTSFLEQLIRSKIEKKISRVQKPGFIAALDVESIDLGSAAPVISNLRLRDLNISGDLTLAFDMRYNGGVKVVISALAKLDLGTRFKARTVDLVLATSLQRLQGHMLIRIKPPPSNRIWFCFESMPDMEIKVEPVVSQRQITYTFILRALEERIRAVVGETLVKPNWDDVPFFDTSAQRVRGGIWKTEGLENEVTVGSASKTHNRSASTPAVAELRFADPEKTSSTPNLITKVSEDPSNSGSESFSSTSAFPGEALNSLKRRSVASLPLDSAKGLVPTEDGAPVLNKSLRSPSFTNPSPSAPSVALAGAEVASVRADDATLQPKRWLSRPPQFQQTKKDAVEAIREMRNRSFFSNEADSVTDKTSTSALQGPKETIEVFTAEPDELDEDASKIRRHSDSRASSVSSTRKRTMTGFGTTPRESTIRSNISVASSNSSTAAPSRVAQQRKNIIAATAAATTAARNWSWNTLASKKNQGSQSSTDTQSKQQQPGLTEPVGRGQPLPPPGVPLPGPQQAQKSLWAGSGLAAVGSLRRKPVPALPPRPKEPSNPFSIPKSHCVDTEIGHPLHLTWKPTTPGPVTLILRSEGTLDGGTTIASSIPNSGSFTWNVPTNTSPGSSYAIAIIDDVDPSKTNHTPIFNICSKDATNMKALVAPAEGKNTEPIMIVRPPVEDDYSDIEDPPMTSEIEDEFGPWNENDGARFTETHQREEDDVAEANAWPSDAEHATPPEDLIELSTPQIDTDDSSPSPMESAPLSSKASVKEPDVEVSDIEVSVRNKIPPPLPARPLPVRQGDVLKTVIVDDSRDVLHENAKGLAQGTQGAHEVSSVFPRTVEETIETSTSE
ncbi:putative ph domain-containing protein [Acrodontium crateriforme]|uniref:Ph domain-containing protein n=1 Tax=Acrodontium crateriforme TaxID=150365 RepID=A0AAQ3M4Y5_9PEZI|nr:putative ph domain-containing protein [Acrodontium crateriforme]